jgi:hypothetical protein
VRKAHDNDCLTETNVRKPSLKELAQQVIDRHEKAMLAESLETRIRAMAERCGFSTEELAEELTRVAADPAKAASWVERDERNYGQCVTPAAFAAAYAVMVVGTPKVDS